MLLDRVGGEEDQAKKALDDDVGRGLYDELHRHMDKFNRYPVLSSDEFTELHKRWKEQGDREAYDLMVYSNARLVLSVALKHGQRGVRVVDMVQEGFFGLMTAVDKFDPARGHHFSTYATWWIRQAIQRNLCDRNERRPYRIPVHVQEKMVVVAKAAKSFVAEHGRHPEKDELFLWIHRHDDTEEGSETARKITQKELERCLRLLAEKYKSFDLPIRDRKNGEDCKARTVGDQIEDGDVDSEAATEARRLLEEYKGALERIEQVIDTLLKPREAMVLRLRLGMGEFEQMTLEEVGERYDLTRERIRQIQAAGVKKLEAELGIGQDEIEKIIAAIDELRKLTGAEEEAETTSNGGPSLKTDESTLKKLFDLLCEHTILTPLGLRIIKAPLQVLKVRAKIPRHEGRTILQKLQDDGHIQEHTQPWEEVRVIPEIALPTFDGSEEEEGGSQGITEPTCVQPTLRRARLPKPPVQKPPEEEVVVPPAVPAPTETAKHASGAQGTIMEVAIQSIERQLPELRVLVEAARARLSKMEDTLRVLQAARDNNRVDADAVETALKAAETATVEYFSQLRLSLKQG